MSIHDGVVTLDDQHVPVILGFEEDTIRMSSNGAEIGDWGPDEVSIDPTSDGAYTITAENETLLFMPTNPTTFAADVLGGVRPAIHIDEEVEVAAPSKKETASSRSAAIVSEEDVPPAQPITRIAFYTLAGVTTLLGLWALYSLIF